MNNLELILNFIGQHPIVSFMIVSALFSWRPIKIIRYDKENKEE